MKTLNTLLFLFVALGLSTVAWGQGDNCAAAASLTPVSGVNSYSADGPSTGSGASNLGNTGATNADWYTFTASYTGTMDIASCNGGADTRLTVHDGTCAALNVVGYNDDACADGTGTNYASLVTSIPVTSGTTYYIEWDDRWSNSAFTWELTAITCPDLDPATFGTGVVTSSTAEVGWNSNGALESLVEWGPTGFTLGTGTAVSVTTDTLSLTGLAQLTSYDVYVRRVCAVGDSSLTYVGPFTFSTTLPCPDPTNVAATNLMPNSADISYQSNSPAPNGIGQIALGTGSFSPNNPPLLITMTTNPYTLTGLIEATTYTYYVRDVCDPLTGSASQWVGPFTFTTPLPPAVAPILFDFEGESTFQTTGTLNNGWQLTPTTGAPNWAIDINGTSSSNTGPRYDHTNFGVDGGRYAYLETSGANIANYDSIVGVPVDLDTFTAPALSFWYHMYGSTMGTLEAFISNDGGATYTSVWSLSGQQQTDDLDPWLQANVDLTAYAGQIVIVKFRGNGSSYTSDMAIDDISLGSPPPPITCPGAPSALTAFNITTTSADVSFSPANGATLNYEIEYGPAGFAQGSGTLVSSATLPISISGLMASTSYDVYARDVCDPATGDVSAWSQVYNFVTNTPPCASVLTPTVLPFVEDFEWGYGITIAGANGSLYCTTSHLWDFETSTAQGRVYAGTDGQEPCGGTGGLSLDATVNGASPDPVNYAILTLDMSSYVANPNDIALSVELIDNGDEPDPNDRIWIRGSDTDTWIEILDWSGFNNNSCSGVNVNFNVTSSLAGASQSFSSTFQVRFGQEDNFTYGSDGLSIDNLTIREVSCTPPTALGATPGFTTATLFWTTGGSGLHNVVVTPAGTGLGFPLVAAYGVTDEFYDIAPPATLQAATSYDFYVQDSCALDGIASSWVGPFTFTTLDPACFITAPYTETFDAATLNSCWTQDQGDDGDWLVDAGGTPSGGTGPSGDTTTPAGTGNYMFIETSSPVLTGDEFILISPTINTSALTNPELEFFYHMWDDGTQHMGDLEVWIEAPAASGNWQQALMISGDQGNAWKQANIDLGAFLTDNTVRAAFLGRKGPSFRSDVAIDQVSFQDGPACPAPVAVFVDNIVGSDATVNWMGTAGTFTIEYGPLGFTPGTGTGTVVTGATGGSATITGLMAATEYDVYITGDCGGAGTSTAVGPVEFVSDCGVFVGDDFTDPIVVGALPYADTNRTDICYSNAIANANGYTAADVVYQITTGSAPCQALTASMCGPLSDYDGYIYLYDANFVEVATGDDDCGIGGGPGEIVGIPVAPNATYYVVVSGWSGSEGTYELAISSGTRSVAVSSTVSDATTIGGADGYAIASASGGVAPYNYAWGNGAVGDSIGGLTAGDYSVIVTDALGCSSSATITVGEPCPANLGLSITSFNNAQGGAAVTATAGTAPYTYAWNNGGTASFVDSTGTGTFSVVVTDANGCTDSISTDVVSSTIGIEGLNDVKLFPNPTVDQAQLSLSFDNATDVRIELVTIDGKVLSTEMRNNVVDRTFNLDVSKYSSGVYMVRITANDQTTTRKLVVMKP